MCYLKNVCNLNESGHFWTILIDVTYMYIFVMQSPINMKLLKQIPRPITGSKKVLTSDIGRRRQIYSSNEVIKYL